MDFVSFLLLDEDRKEWLLEPDHLTNQECKLAQEALPASDDADSLERTVARRIVEGPENGDVTRLKDSGGTLRLRIGDWRVLFQEAPAGNIRALRVLHRSKAYR